MTKKIGRFDIVRELGRGAQSVVYLARDPHLEREVAIKTLHFTRPDPEQNRVLLAEARTVSQMRHPNIVPIFEAGEEGGDLYLVFEFVPGKNLGEYLRESGALSPVRAISVMQPVLDAIAHAHALGVIHRDLKPTNILINEDGFPRVMDFGIAARVEQATAEGGDGERLMGTPSYMAPEYVLRQEIGERTDVFAAGLIFYELLTGQRAIQGNDLFALLHRITSTDIRLPPDSQLDERITAILYRAIARDPESRYATVVQFREALDDYLDPEEEAGAATAGGQGTIEFLLRRMRHKSDFPALSESVGAINKIAASDRESIGKLSSTILKDFALTNKILKLVNSAFYRQAGGGNISTVSRAVMVLGFDAVRNIAITVLLFEHLQNKTNASQLQEEFLRACLAGLFARELARRLRLRDGEQSYICAVFHNLGRLLCQFYFPEESEDIRRVVQQHGCSEESAAQRVLGAGYEELGIALARAWGFPELIQNSMRTLPEGPVHAPRSADERLQSLAACANACCDAVSRLAPAERERALADIAARFDEAVPVPAREAREHLRSAVDEIGEFARVVKVSLAQTRFGRNLRHFIDGSTPAEGARVDATLMPASALLEQSLPAEGGAEGQRAADPQAVLSAGIQDISNSLVEDFRLNDVLRIILETMYRAMGFKRVLLCVRDARSNAMCGRFGFGPEVGELAKQLRFSLSAQPDNVFNVATARGVDVLISDVDDPKIAARVPAWYRRSVAARTFVLFPLTIKGRPVAMIYADKDRAGELRIGEQELAMLRTLRNQAVLAIKQAG